jgi:osmoprotectant transport system ATP-binding protein
VLEVDSVIKRYRGVAALDGVSLRVTPGRTTALIGPSGCGKSTLIRLLVGLIEPDEGQVRFDGEALAPPRLPEVRRRLGYVIQSGGLFPHMTARQNATLPATHAGAAGGWTPAKIDARLNTLAALTHFPEDALDRHPTELSGGQRQRVSLMRALFLDPEALLLDEPLGALDPLIRAELQHELREIFATLGKTVVLVTHDLAEAAYLAGDEIVLLREGRIEQHGAFAELRDCPASSFVERFISAQMERVEALAVPRRAVP